MQLNAYVIREEKSLRHFVMEAKFLDDNNLNFCVVSTYNAVLYQVGAWNWNVLCRRRRIRDLQKSMMHA